MIPNHTYSLSLRRHVRILTILSGMIFSLTACFDDSKSQKTTTKQISSSQEDIEKTTTSHVLTLQFVYDWEKQPWIEAVTTDFNAQAAQISDGQTIQVQTVALPSWTAMNDVLSGKRQAHLLSPASSTFIKLGNARSQRQMGLDMVGYTENLVLSPLVIALWEPMAKLLGWDKQPVGWGDILALIKNPAGWESHGYPQWGRFKLGHPHPAYSNDGLLALMTQVYAGADKLTDLSLAKLQQPKISQYLHELQTSVAHYGRSSRFFYQEFLSKDPSYLSAIILSENKVVQSYNDKLSAYPLVAIYPKEGTLWSEHPIGIVEREWVTPAHREAAHLYMEFLLNKPQQEKALQYGFRPANVRVPLAAPLDIAHGVNPEQPQVTLEVPSLEVIEALIKMWHQQKKPTHLMLVLDTSGSMRGDKIRQARQSVAQLIEILEDNDMISLLTFDNELNWMANNIPVAWERKKLQRQLQYQFAGGGTILYEAIEEAYSALLATRKQENNISIMIVFSDGDDSHSQVDFQKLLTQVSFDSEQRPIWIFTVGYGSSPVGKKRLHEIATITYARFYEGGSSDNNLLQDLVAFF
jgi:Ca-activated chloride channel family protein